MVTVGCSLDPWQRKVSSPRAARRSISDDGTGAAPSTSPVATPRRPSGVTIATAPDRVEPRRGETGVADVCVIGVPDSRWDQNIKAVIVRTPGTKFVPEQFVEHRRARLAWYKKPRLIALTDALPRAATGFVDRAAVDAALGGGGYPRVG